VHAFQVFNAATTFILITSESTATLADFLVDGPAPGTGYSWRVIGYAPVASVDAMAATSFQTQTAVGTLTSAQSASRTFTTFAP
jgi:hypothetical protein